MKKTLIIITLIVVAFSLICCDADSIVKAGENLMKIRNVNGANVNTAVELALNFATASIDGLIGDTGSGFDPVIGNMTEEQLKALIGLVNVAKETTVPDETITSMLNKKAAPVAQGDKLNIQIKETIDNFLTNVHNEQFIDSMKQMLKNLVPEKETQIADIFTNQLSKVEKIVRSIEPAIDALQSINDQSYNHDGMTYGDVIGRAVMYHTTQNLILLLTGVGTENLKTEIINTVVSDLTALEVIYNVTFDAPQIAGNFIGNL